MAKGFALYMAVLGLVLGLFYSVGGAIYDLWHGQLGFGTILAFFAIIGMPIIFAILGYMLGAIVAIFYEE